MKPLYCLATCVLGFLATDSTTSLDDDILPSQQSGSTVVSATHWRMPNETLTCLVREPERELTVHRQTERRISEIFRFKSDVRLISMYPLWDSSGDLMTVWQGGSAYHFNVFCYSGSKVRLVLEAGSKSPPEIITAINSRDQKPYILATDTMGYQERGQFLVLTTRLDLHAVKLPHR